jgi:hypothetical protein
LKGAQLVAYLFCLLKFLTSSLDVLTLALMWLDQSFVTLCMLHEKLKRAMAVVAWWIVHIV